MANTTNFGWETPDDTDLVKDGAAAMRTLGNSIDASFVDLKGGSTGQVLSKNSNTDLDFTWVAQDDSNAIQNTIVDAKGDLISATAADTPARLAVGTNGQVLTADSTTATGLKWAAVSSGMTLINTGGTTLTGSSVTVSSIPTTYKNLFVYIEDFYATGGSVNGAVRFNGDTGSNYSGSGLLQTANTGSATPTLQGNNAADRLYLYEQMTGTSQGNFGYFQIPNYASTTHKKVVLGNAIFKDTDTYNKFNFGVWYATPAAITSMAFVTSGTWAGGTVYVYGAN